MSVLHAAILKLCIASGALFGYQPLGCERASLRKDIVQSRVPAQLSRVSNVDALPKGHSQAEH